jgi:hypothetical protein
MPDCFKIIDDNAEFQKAFSFDVRIGNIDTFRRGVQCPIFPTHF